MDLGWKSKAPRSNRFMVLDRLGEGGMGAVYEALDQERSARVALKVLRLEGPEAVLRFKGEFRKLQDLHHPNLVSLGELVEEAGQWFFTMELVHGCDFLSYVRPEPWQQGSATLPQGPSVQPSPSGSEGTTDSLEATLPQRPSRARSRTSASPQLPPGPPQWPLDEQRLRSALGQLALGLHALHRAGKVHRDIKPSNILVTPHGRLVLLDFGILADVEAEEDWDRSVVVGTAAYMAPEQAQGAAPSPEADWYSVGVVLYLALTGRRPFSGSQREVLARKLREEPPPPQQWVPGLPEDLCRLCCELLRREPSERPAGEQVLQRLGMAQAAAAQDWGPRALPFVGRRAELRALQAALADSRRGYSVVARVEGESGVGKSRLVRRFLEEMARAWPEAVVLSGRCYERESVPYKGVDGLVDSLARFLSGSGRSLALSVPPEQVAALVQLFPVLQRVEGLAPSGLPPAAGDPLPLRLAAFAALRELLGQLARHRPLVLSVDDLQWADRDSAALLDAVLRAPGLLLVATVRLAPEGSSPPDAADSRFWQQARVVPLQGLPLEDARSLAEQLLGEGAEPGQAELERMAQESGGHPLFLEALVRHLGRTPRGSALPQLEQALWARAQQLEPRALHLLALLSVAGAPLTHGVATHAAGLQPTEYSRLTASLRGARLVITSGPAASDSVEVLHDRVRQAVLPHLPPAERQQWHKRLAHTLEELGQGQSETLAYHWREAGQGEQASHYYLRAAQEASQALAFSRAARLYQAALELGRWSPAEQHRLRVAYGEVLSHAGRGGEAARVFLSAAQGQPRAQERGLLRRAAEQYLLSGHLDEGLARSRQVLEALGMPLPPESSEAARQRLRRVRLRLWLRLWLRPWPQGPTRELSPEQRELLETLGSLASGLSMVDPVLAPLFQAHYLLLAHAAGEPHHLCRALCFELLRVARNRSHQHWRLRRLERRLRALAAQLEADMATQGLVATTLAFKSAMVGDFTSARPLFERAEALLRRCKGVHWERYMAWSAGCSILGMMGDLGQMRQRSELLLAEAWERGNLYGLTALELNSGTLRWLGADQPQQGRRAADEVIALWSQGRYLLQHFGHLCSHLYVDLYEGQADQALSRLAESWPRLTSILEAESPVLRGRVLDLRVRARLMKVVQRGPGPQLLGAVQADARALEALKYPVSKALGALARAGLADVRGEGQVAVRYGQAAAALERAGLLLHATAARMRQGELLGGPQGRALGEVAREWMTQRGIVHPKRMAAMYVPTLGQPAPGEPWA